MTVAVADRSLEREYIRDSEGQFADVPGVPNLGDKLKVVGRIPLGDGEKLVGSDVFKTRDSGVVPVALTQGPGGRRLRIGTGIHEDDKRRWAGRNLGSTANLDEAGLRELRGALDQMKLRGDEGGKRFRAVEDRAEELDQERRDIVKRQYASLSRSQAKRLDEVDRRLAEVEAEIESREAGLRDTARFLAENDPQGRQRWDEIVAEIAALDPDDPDDRGRIERLEAEQGRIPPSPRTRETLRVLPRLREEREDWLAEQRELTADPSPLSPADQADLARVEAEIADNAAQREQMEESVLFGGTIPGEWADLVYEVSTHETTYEYENMGIEYRIAVRPKDADADWYPHEDNGATNLRPNELAKLAAMLDELTSGRSPESFNRYRQEVRSMPLSRALEAFAVMSPSPAVQLMMLARALEADSFMRRGKLVNVERGRGGKFAKKGVAEVIGDAVGAMADAFAAADPVDKPARRTKKSTVDMPALVTSLRDRKSGDDYVDIDAAVDELKALSHAQLNEVEDDLGYDRGKGTREQRAKRIADTLYKFRNDTIAINRASRRLADERRADMPTEIEAKNYFGQLKAGFSAANERERVEKAAAVKPVAPKKAARRATMPSREEQIANLNAISGGEDIWAKLRKAHEEEGSVATLPASTPTLKGPRPMATRRPRKSERPDRAEQLAAISGGEDIWAKIRKADEENARASDGNDAKVTRINQITAELRNVTDREQRSRLQAEQRRLGAEVMGVPSPIDDAVDSLRPMVDNPKAGDREKTAAILGKLSGKQLEEVAKAYGVGLLGRTVVEKRNQLVERLVGFALNSLIIRNSPWTQHADAIERS